MKKYRSNINRKYPRDMIGYGSKKIQVKWPNNARIALQIVLNYEEGAENCVLHGDKNSEVFLSEIIGAQPIKGRHMNMESFYEYGSRRGFWRIHELFQEKNIPLTIFGVGMALEIRCTGWVFHICWTGALKMQKSYLAFGFLFLVRRTLSALAIQKTWTFLLVDPIYNSQGQISGFILLFLLLA